MNHRFNEIGLTLIELLASIVILGIIIISVGSFFVHATKYSSASEHQVTNAQIAYNLLTVYKNKSFEELKNKACPYQTTDKESCTETISLPGLLNFEGEGLEHLQAIVTLTEHENRTLRDHLVVINIIVQNATSEISDQYELTGYVRNTGS